MNEDTVNIEVRKFLKTVGIASQREIEHAILKAAEAGNLPAAGSVAVKMTLSAPELGIEHCTEGSIALD